MGDLRSKNPKSPPLSLPPGFRFHPTEQQILSLYLTNKNNNQNPNLKISPFIRLDVISEIDLYNYDPYDLPEIDSFPYGYGGSKKHWYYFTVNQNKGLKRRCKGGFWKRKCRPRNVMCGEDGNLLGTKTSFVFYRREKDRDSSSSRCCRTNWVMIEYALVDHHMDFFVLCRVFLRTCSANKSMEAGLNLHAEETFAEQNCSIAVPCRQVDRASKSGTGEVVAHEEDCDNNVRRLPHQLPSELNNQVPVRQLSDNGVGSSLDAMLPNQLVNISSGFIGNGVTFDDVAANELGANSIINLEGDYLELDDLIGPIRSFCSSG